MIYLNTKHVRDYESTNLVACEADQAPSDHWKPADERSLVGLTNLGSETSGGKTVKWYGFL